MGCGPSGQVDRLEFEEETTAKVLSSRYLFVVENRFVYDGQTIQAVEHYLEVEIDMAELKSRESHLSQHWLPLTQLLNYDLRPTIVRNAIYTGAYLKEKHLVVENADLPLVSNTPDKK
jgi:hypothetical protein